jgi:sodium transport system permease protein
MWTIYLKELLELARDRRTFFFTVFIPVFAMPLIFGGFGLLSNSMFKQASTADMAYAMFGKEHAPQLAARFAREKAFTKLR